MAPLPTYEYRARTTSGELRQGLVSAATEREAADQLRRQGLVVTGLRESGAPAAAARASLTGAAERQLTSARRDRRSLRRIPLRDLAAFCRQLSTLLSAGVPILTALEVLASNSAHPRLRSAVHRIVATITAGHSLTAAFEDLADAFPPVLVSAVRAGEVGGVLDEVLDRLATQFDKEDALASKVKTAMFYPTIVSITAVIVLGLMVTFVLPSFLSIFENLGAELPPVTRFLLAVSDSLRRHWYVYAGSVLAALAGLRLYARTTGGAERWDRFKLRLPIFGDLLLRQAMARFSRTLSVLLRSGVPILVALEAVDRTVGNRELSRAIAGSQDAVRRGESIIGPLRQSGRFPPLVIEMMVIGEETGQLDTLLGKAADFYEAEVDRLATRLPTMLEPIIIVMLGVAVALIMVAVVVPMFDLWTQIE